MKLSSFFAGALVAASTAFRGVLAQTYMYTEPTTGIDFYTFNTQATTGGLTWGFALPPNAMTVDATEYIGLVIAPINQPGPSWSGISHYISMTEELLLMYWPNGNEILTSFRWASGYVTPDVYSGTPTPTLTQLYSNVNSTYYTLVYRCQNCLSWDQSGVSGNWDSATSGAFVLGWCNAYSGLVDPTNVNTTVSQQHDSYNIEPFEQPSSAVAASYSVWATKTYGGGGSTSTTGKSTTTTGKTTTNSMPTTTGSSSTLVSSTTSSSSYSGTPAPTTTYDYIIAGGGAGGITIADKLSEAGHSVLLIERGPASSYRWGGRNAPAWLSATNSTRFDCVGLDNEIWENATGIACTDNDMMTGCVLGGGTAINAGLWWHVPDIDWNYNFPAGWQATDTAAAVSRVFERIPGEYVTSEDGKYYYPQGYELIGGALAAAGWQNVTANSVPNSKNRTFSHPPWMYSYGERGGPLATYLVTANARPNFKMILNTDVKRVIRTGGHITGVETYAYAPGGYEGVFNVTATTGRVILSAGTFGTSRVLFRSGIGPSDMMSIVQQSTDNATFINKNEWINLPVGYNLDDHLDTDIVISHPSIEFYDFYAAFNTPIQSDADAYVQHRSGMLAQSAPNIAPLMWEEIACSDGITRQLQWTSRCEGSRGAPNNYSMTLSQYLGRGATSRGRATMDSMFNMHVSQLPYLQSAGDLEAVVQGVANMQAVLNKVANLTWLYPSPGQNATDYVSQYPIVASQRTANHWLGTAKLGTDDGRAGGTAVVDLNTKVYGTDNLFVVDASIFPGMMSTNPSAMIVAAAEHASEKLAALAANTVVAKYAQCGGQSYSGSMACAAGSTCTWSNAYYSQCL